MSKELIKNKDTFFTKIRNFFINLFKKDNKKVQEYESYEEKDDSKNEFLNNIAIKEDEEKLKILRLQKEYKEGKIIEEELTEDEYQKLIELYKQQNQMLKEKIQNKKNILRKKLDNLNA